MEAGGRRPVLVFEACQGLKLSVDGLVRTVIYRPK